MKAFPDWAREIATPAIVYDLRILKKSARMFRQLSERSGAECCFAVKANRQPSVLSALAEEGFGADIASEAELKAALTAGFRRITATGPGLSAALCMAVSRVGGTVFYDRAEQIYASEAAGVEVQGQGLRLSLPGPYSHFGFSGDELAAVRSAGYDLRRFHMHNGERLSIADFQEQLTALEQLVSHLRPVELDLGGGFGILSNDPDKLAEAFELIGGLRHRTGAAVTIEPGKAIVARCGFLVATVLEVKYRGNDCFAFLDASSFNFGDMERRVIGATTSMSKVRSVATIVGNTCYEGDVWGRFNVPTLQAGDKVVFSLMGAYTASIAGSLHGLPLPHEYLLSSSLEVCIPSSPFALCTRA